MYPLWKLHKLFFLLLTLSGCAGSPLLITELNIYTGDEVNGIEAKPVPGIIPSAIKNEKTKIVAFGIHGMGVQDFCSTSIIAEMFTDRFVTNGPTGFSEKCGSDLVQPYRVLPVCLSQKYELTSEAYHSGGEKLHIGSECESASGEFDVTDLDIEKDDKQASSPRTISRFGTLMQYKLRGRYTNEKAEPVDIEIEYFGYWWHGDGDALQAPFVFHDEDPSHKGERAWLNKILKTKVMNEGLVDAALLNGNGRKIMLEGTRGALCLTARLLMSEKLPNDRATSRPCENLDDAAATEKLNNSLKDSQLVLLSQSLGSRLLFDALSFIETNTSRDGCPTPKSALYNEAALNIADAFVKSNPLFYMSANQLPLLAISNINLGTKSRNCIKSEKSANAKSAQQRAEFKFFNELLDSMEEPASVSVSFNPREQKQGTALISFYDPNDMLGYRAGLHLKKQYRDNIIEVTQRYAIPLFLLALPNAAHDQSFDRRKGQRLVMCGGKLVGGSHNNRLRINRNCF